MAEKQSTIALVCRLYLLDMATICKVILLTDTAIGLVNDNGKFVLDLLDPEIECRYSEPREIPELAKKFDLTTEQQCLSSLTFIFRGSMTSEVSEADFEPESATLMELTDCNPASLRSGCVNALLLVADFDRGFHVQSRADQAGCPEISKSLNEPFVSNRLHGINGSSAKGRNDASRTGVENEERGNRG